MLIHSSHKGLPNRLVVLGGSGFVGGVLVALAKALGIAFLSVTSRDVDLCADNAGEKLANLLKPTDSVIFAAAIDKGSSSGSDILMKNIAMARSVADAARRMPFAHLIYLSSDSVYAYQTSLINETTSAAPTLLYGMMHRTREMILATEATIPLSVIRLTGVYGTQDTHNAYGPNRFMRQAIKEHKITLFGEGEEMRDHLYVKDAAKLVMQVATHRSTGTLNLAMGQSISFYALAQKIAAFTGAKIEYIKRKQPITHRHFDITHRLRAFPNYVLMPLGKALTEILEESPTSLSSFDKAAN